VRKEIIAIIPARSGSKGVKNKNILKIKSKTLIEISVLQAKKIKLIDEIIISSDSEEYVNYGRLAGANSLGLRPSELSNDKTKTIEVLKYLLKSLPDAETILLLQPTAPIRSTHEIEKALKICTKEKKCVISISELDEPNPYKLKTLNQQNIITPFINDDKYNSETPRQLLPKTFRLTGGFYCLNVEQMLKFDSVIPKGSIGYPTKMYPNIDTKNDFDYINWLIDTNKNLPSDFLEILSNLK
tara:strand:- start:209 stop:934 length:726 start_codon:yes stop_codon:yes gene_type:complete